MCLSLLSVSNRCEAADRQDSALYIVRKMAQMLSLDAKTLSATPMLQKTCRILHTNPLADKSPSGENSK